ncbi:MAG: CotH kinase family protein [Muribaculaceae bacterium]|nr:CotH kinase family protein [Muribaculaceae bacterium]
MKYLTLLCLLMAASLPLSAKEPLNVSVYRNDGLFNNFRMYEGDSITHVADYGGMCMVINDFIAGQTKVPLSAIDSLVIHATDIPVLRIAFPDYPEATSLWEKDLYLDALLSIEGNGYTEDMNSLSLQIKGRGNSTWGMPKKPMRLKFPKKLSVCDFKKAKNFVLLNNYVDPSLMRNAMALWLAKRLGVPYSNTIVPCNVFINGSYAGSYTMTEKVGINTGSVDIDETEGILFELSTEYDEKYRFRSPRWDLPVMVKDPDFDELYEDNPDGLPPDRRLDLWEKDFIRAEELIAQGKAAEAFDVESAVNYLFLYLFMGNPELSHPKSLYIHKKSLGENEKYFFGPAWDFDISCNYKQEIGDNTVTQSATSLLWLPPFLKRIYKTEEFQVRYKERMKDFHENIFPEFLSYLDSYAKLIEPSAKLNGVRWGSDFEKIPWIVVEPSFDTENHVRELRQWFVKRAEYMKTAILF